MNRTTEKAWDVVTSLKLTIVCLAALMILVGVALINWMDTGCAAGNC